MSLGCITRNLKIRNPWIVPFHRYAIKPSNLYLVNFKKSILLSFNQSNAWQRGLYHKDFLLDESAMNKVKT